MKRTGFLSFALMATLTAACSNDRAADLDPGARGTEPANVGSGVVDITSEDAEDFVRHLAMVDKAEVELGKLAVERATSSEVKQFAQIIIDDHTLSGDKLAAIASDLKIASAGPLEDKHHDRQDELAKRSGADFDREYVSAMVDRHKDLVDQLESRIDKKTLLPWKEMNAETKAARGAAALLPDQGDNPTTMRLNQFAADIYPTVYAHLEAARALERSLKKRETTP